MLKSIHFNSQALAYLLVAPQVIITLVFFIWPAGQALYQSFLIEDAFGLGSEFVWFENFIYLFEDDYYGESFGRTALFSFLVAVALPAPVNGLPLTPRGRRLSGACF